MKIKLYALGKTAFKYLNEGIEIYHKRLKHYAPFEYTEIPLSKPSKKASFESIKVEEGKKLLKAIGNDDFLVLFDEKGKEYSSENFAKFLEKNMVAGRKTLTFVIGGAYGFSSEVYARSNAKIALSQMTLSHQMVRLFAIEQIYRGQTILKGEPYHHE